LIVQRWAEIKGGEEPMKKIYCDICGDEIPIDSKSAVSRNWHKLILEPIPKLDSSFTKSIDICKVCTSVFAFFMTGNAPKAFKYLVNQYKDKIP